jgi:hypothetical protein
MSGIISIQVPRYLSSPRQTLAHNGQSGMPSHRFTIIGQAACTTLSLHDITCVQ